MNRTYAEISADLGKPLSADLVAQRSQAGRSLSYIESHTAIREANRIFGFDGWTRETTEMRIVQEEQKESNNKTLWYIGYTCKVVVNAMSTHREGTGFGQGQDADLGKAHESAIKEAESDAMKRALMTFGDPFGLALYDKKQEHVEKPVQGSQNRAGASKPVSLREWTSRDLSDALGKFDLKMSDLAPILGGEVTAQSYRQLINDYLDANPTENLGTLTIRAAAKAGKKKPDEPLPEVTPAALTPTSDVRQPQMAGVN